MSVTIVLMLYYDKSVSATLKDLDSSENGLAVVEAEERLRIHGKNTVTVKGEPLWRKVIEPFANVFMLVLFIAATISLFQHEILDSVIIILIMVISATIYYVQRFSTERIMRSLSKHQTQNVDVMRDGLVVRIDTELLVPGDVIILREGEKIPADARLIVSDNVRSDESMLTGESQPINKQTDALHGEKQTYECTNLLFQGAFIIAGTAHAVVTSTGNSTQFGQLAALAARPSGTSPIQGKIDKLITQIVAVVAGIAVTAFGLALLRGMEITEAIRFVIALSVSAVPEGLPIAIAVVLVLGVRRMAARKALVRSMRAIETIGAITTIATDKTGTLTQNKLTVGKVWQPPFSRHPIDEYIQKSVNGDSDDRSHDPLDKALLDYVSKSKMSALKHKVIATLPFDQSASMSGNIWDHGATLTLDVKGAPEHVLQRSNLTSGEHEKAQRMLHEMTGEGYRVIALATTTIGKKIKKFEDLPKGQKFDFVGFVAVSDILRPEAKRAISAALNAGVTVRMVTGDHVETAYHIARELGMAKTRDQVFDARHMNVMSDDELDKAISDVRVFARVIPEHKYRILELLKRHNITAMTGDGVNDVPALSDAHVGLAMGSGSQIAKDAGDIILLDDNFKSVIDAMHEGRVTISNIRRMLYYLLSTSSGEVLTMIGSLAVGLPLPILPVQILWVNLVTDTAMVIPLGLEPGEKNVMKQRPKKPKSPILNKFIITRMVLVAFSMAITVLVMFAYFIDTHGEEYARTIAFSALVVMQWSNAFNARSDHQSLFTRLRTWNGPFYVGLSIAVTLQVLVLVGPLGSVLHVSTVAIQDVLLTGLIAFVIPIVLVEIHKMIGRQLAKRKRTEHMIT